jgi:hypothetical protein
MNRFLASLIAACVAGVATVHGVQATAGSRASQLTIDVGDVVQVAGGDIGCKVVRRRLVKTLDCRRAGPLPGTFGVMIDKERVVVARFETAHTAKIILSAHHGRRTVSRCS